MEENWAKLNLSALVGWAKDTSNNNTSEEKPTASEVLSSQNIQDNTINTSPAPEKKEVPHISLSIPQSPESIQGKPADTSPTPEQKVTPSEELAWPRISFFAMQKKKEETTKRGEEKKAQEAKQNNSVSPLNHEKPAELFNNYTPSFDGRAKKLFRQLREISMQPKTRTSLLIALIVWTIWFISYLFVTHPEKHSFKIYKDSIVEAFQKKPSQEVAKNTTNTDIPSPVETWSTETWSTSLNGNTWASDSTSTPTPSEEETKKKEIEKLRNEKIRAYFSK